MWTWWAIAACGSDPPAEDASNDDDLDLQVDPTSLDFGVVAPGETATRSLVLHNGGTSDVLVTPPSASSPAFEVTGFVSPTIRPGTDVDVEVVWTPDAIGESNGSLRMRVGTSSNALSDLEVPLVGFVSGADLTPSVTSWDAGLVKVGCVATLALVLTNTGNEDLVISSLSFTNDLEFTIDDGAGAAPILPIHVAAQQATTLNVVYTPTDDQLAETTLQIVTNDALAPTTSVEIDGAGSVEESNSMRWTVLGKQAITGIIAPNEETTDGPLSDNVRDEFLPAFFDTLLSTRLPFRIAVVMNEDGHVDGDLDFIDDTFTVDEAVDAAKEMLEGLSSYGDNDQTLETCLNAIEGNAWLLDDGEIWAQSKLNLVGINTDSEQSPGSAAYYIGRYEEYKDIADLAVHGIAGESPGGCSGSEVFGIPSWGLYDAAGATGGAFLSVCTKDWTKTGVSLASAFRDGIETFVLEGDPQPSSIVVSVDYVEVPTGWTYDADTRSILFDDATYPERDSDLRVDYVMAVTCD